MNHFVQLLNLLASACSVNLGGFVGGTHYKRPDWGCVLMLTAETRYLDCWVNEERSFVSHKIQNLVILSNDILTNVPFCHRKLERNDQQGQQYK